MANWLTEVLRPHITKDDTILDVCCGIGGVIDALEYKEITGVDAYTPYLQIYASNIKNSSIFEFNLENNNIEEAQFYKNYDIVLWVDGIEHLTKENAIIILEKLEKIAVKKIIIFTPEHADDPNKITKNTPESAWGIEGGSNWQTHKCALPRDFFKQRGYSVQQLNKTINVYDKSFYYEMLYVKEIK